MAIDRTFEAAFQKAVRSLEITNRSITWEDPSWFDQDGSILNNLPIHPNDERLWAVLAGLRRNVSPDELSRRTGIDPWFTRAFARIIGMEKTITSTELTYDTFVGLYSVRLLTQLPTECVRIQSNMQV